jgi:hypothetical protein
MFDKKNITKEIDLDNNLGLSMYLNYASQQTHTVYEVFYNFLKNVKPKRILEIGTAQGGFTSFLNLVSKENNLNIDILSYDVVKLPWYDDMVQNGMNVRVENIFNYDYSIVEHSVIDFIQRDGITIVLCDGGYKKGEFNLLSDYLKKGDIIMAHDYCFDYEKFEDEIKFKIWNWCEITELDIVESCKRNNLESYNQTIFDSVVWVCKIKK